MDDNQLNLFRYCPDSSEASYIVAISRAPPIGQHNDEVYGGWLGLSAGELAELRQNGVT